MKTFKVVSVMLIVMMSVTFMGCSKEDEDNASPIVGTWFVEKTYDIGTSYEYTSYSEITYNIDGRLTGLWIDTYKDGHVVTEHDNGKYEIRNNLLMVWWDSDNDTEAWTVTFTIDGNTMTTSEAGGTVWTRK